jgi:chemotaxis protein histidine kinase CheA/ActR/RegA family two-component response regulator
MDKSSLTEYYLMEAEEHIDRIQNDLLCLEKDPAGTDLQEFLRAAHTLKGAASLLEFNISSHAAHIIEDMMGIFKNKDNVPSREHIDFCFELLDIIKNNTLLISQGKAENTSVLEALDQRFKSLTGKRISPAKKLNETHKKPVNETPQLPARKERREVEKKTHAPAPQLKRESSQEMTDHQIRTLKIKTDSLDEVMNIAGELRLQKDSLLDSYNNFERLSNESQRIMDSFSRLMRALKGILEDSTVDIKKSQRVFDSLIQEFHELEFDDYDESNILWKKLVESTSDIEVVFKELSEENYILKEKLSLLEKYTASLQDSLINVRVTDLAPILIRFERAVRDISNKENKPVSFIASGGDTKVDTSILSLIVDPIVQILRNAVAHGIESPEERKKTGKNIKGTITVNAKRKGNDITIKITDDGRGIDFDKIRKKAIRLGYFDSNEEISEQECLNLIFSPGFSTTDKADHTSGRGIGLDIVKESLSKIGGKLKLDSQPGKGTTFDLMIPLSLAMASGIAVKSGHVEFVIPVSYIDEVFAVHEKDITKKDKKLYINHRNQIIQLYFLSDNLELTQIKGSDEIPIIVVDLGARKVVLAVDEILGHEEIFIKPLSKFLMGLKYYIGTTQSSNGDIRLVLDVFSLFLDDISFSGEMGRSPVKVPDDLKILVVDDSLSIRRYMSACLSQINCKVKTAANGMEAIQVLDKEEFNLVITDLEMPIMHGYELIERIKSTEKISHIPVVVLTSRGNEKYQTKAKELGAQGYLVKPFKDEELFKVVRKMTGYKAAA